MRLLALLLVLLAGCATPTGPVAVKILAINDFHGNLKPPPGGIRINDPADPTKTVNIPAGGIEHLATAVAELRAANPNHVFVAAGDLIGATPLLSALFHDEPAVEALGLAGLEYAAVGNHEFDRGATELLRLQRGGCHPRDGCKGPQPYKGARYQYLAASTRVQASGKPLLPPYGIKRFQGVPVAFIGLTLKGTPAIVSSAAIAGLEFRDEAETVNALVPELRAQGIEAIVVLIHQGGITSGNYDECPGISGAIVDIVGRFDKAVDIVVSGHTHRAYNCRIDGRLVTSAGFYGTVLTQIDLTLDPATRDVTSARAQNVIVRTDRYAKDPAATRLVAAYERLALPLAQRVVGTVGAPLARDRSAAGESQLGQVIADAQLAATRDAGAQVAFMNDGGIRMPLVRRDDGSVRYEDLFSIQPFSNHLVTLTLTGAQLLRLLEEQWIDQPGARFLQVSRGFGYSWDANRPVGARVVPGSVALGGALLDPAARYRVTVNSFMAGGGDNFPVLKQGADARTGMLDIDALELYVKNNPGLSPPPQPRVLRLN